MGIGAAAVLKAFVQHAMAEGHTWSALEVASILGVDTRRLSKWRGRSRLTLEELRAMVEHWSAVASPVHVVVDANGVRVELTGVRDAQAPFRLAAPFLHGGTGRIARAVRCATELQEALGEALTAHPDVLRLVVLRAVMGGPLQRDWRSSVAFEVVRPPMRLAARTWQDQPLDEAYVAMLRALGRQGVHTLVTSTMPAGELRDVYERDGFGGSEIRLLAETPTGVWYLSANAASGPPDLVLGSRLGVLGRLCTALEIWGGPTARFVTNSDMAQ